MNVYLGLTTNEISLLYCNCRLSFISVLLEWCPVIQASCVCWYPAIKHWVLFLQ